MSAVLKHQSKSDSIPLSSLKYYHLNCLQDDLLPYLSGNELKVLSYLYRKSFGNRLKEWTEAFSYEALAEATGLSLSTIKTVMNALLKRELVIRRMSGKSYEYQIQCYQYAQKHVKVMNNAAENRAKIDPIKQPKRVKIQPINGSKFDPMLEAPNNIDIKEYKKDIDNRHCGNVDKLKLTHPKISTPHLHIGDIDKFFNEYRLPDGKLLSMTGKALWKTYALSNQETFERLKGNLEFAHMLASKGLERMNWEAYIQSLFNDNAAAKEAKKKENISNNSLYLKLLISMAQERKSYQRNLIKDFNTTVQYSRDGMNFESVKKDLDPSTFGAIMNGFFRTQMNLEV